MPSPRKRCKTCKRQFTPRRGTNRLHCYECKPERSGNVVPMHPMHPPSEENSLTSLTRQTLADVGRENTWQGMAAIRLAELVDSGFGFNGATGAASTVKAHREAMQVALADSGKKADVIDMIFADEA